VLTVGAQAQMQLIVELVKLAESLSEILSSDRLSLLFTQPVCMKRAMNNKGTRVSLLYRNKLTHNLLRLSASRRKSEADIRPNEQRARSKISQIQY